MFVACQRELCKWILRFLAKAQYDKFRQKPKFDSFAHLNIIKARKTADFVILSKAKNLLWLIRKFSEKSFATLCLSASSFKSFG